MVPCDPRTGPPAGGMLYSAATGVYPTQVAVVMGIADLDVVMAAMQRPEMAAAMAHDGVIPETLVLSVEE